MSGGSTSNMWWEAVRHLSYWQRWHTYYLGLGLGVVIGLGCGLLAGMLLWGS